MSELIVGATLSQAWAIWRGRVPLYWGAAFMALFPFLLAVSLGLDCMDAELAQHLSPFLATVVQLFAVILLSGWFARSVRCASERFRRPAILLIASGLRSGPALLWASLTSTLLLLPAFCALLIPGVYLQLRWSLVGPVTAWEGSERARKRSAALTRGHLSALFAITLSILLPGKILIFLLTTHQSTLLFRTLVGSLVLSLLSTALCVAHERLRGLGSEGRDDAGAAQ